MNRRIALASLLGLCLFALGLPGAESKHAGAEKLGWKLTLQAWTMQKSAAGKTLFDAIDLCELLGIHYLETFPDQVISAADPGKYGPEMTEKQIQEVLEKAKAAHVTLNDYGVTGIPNEEPAARKFFDWIKKMGITIVVAEPKPEDLAMIDKLAGEYGVRVAIHDHPKPSRYWDPDYTFSLIKDLKHVGFCADVGHWKRSNLDPVEVLKKYGDRVYSLHFKDLTGGGGNNGWHDVPWGTGESKAAEMLAVLKDKGFHGPIAIEYEWPWDAGTLGRCVKFFNDEADKLAGK